MDLVDVLIWVVMLGWMVSPFVVIYLLVAILKAIEKLEART